jgi:hypothetical protein
MRVRNYNTTISCPGSVGTICQSLSIPMKPSINTTAVYIRFNHDHMQCLVDMGIYQPYFASIASSINGSKASDVSCMPFRLDSLCIAWADSYYIPRS